MAKRKKERQGLEISLDVRPPKRPKGRPGISSEEVVGRAYNYRRMFWTYRLRKKNEDENEWVRDKPYEWALALKAAKTADEATRALESASLPVQNDFKSLVPLILRVLREQDFPKRRENQFDFLADSIAARGEVSPRRSRDICQEERLKAKRAHHIISYEFKIECSCGFKGLSKEHGCPKCGAKIAIGLSSIYGGGLF